MTPFEIIYDRPYRLPLTAPDLQKADEELTLADYMKRTILAKEVQAIDTLPASPFVFQDSEKPIKPGDWVFIKVIKRKN